LLVSLNAVHYIPDGTRAKLFRRAAEKLGEAKNTAYGWGIELSASRNLAQLGIVVPSIAFEEVYQEIIAVWCGNYWGTSKSQKDLAQFFEGLNTDQLRIVMKMFRENERVKEELSQSKPKNMAVELLDSFNSRLTIEAHKQELRDTIKGVKKL